MNPEQELALRVAVPSGDWEVSYCRAKRWRLDCGSFVFRKSRSCKV